MYLSHLKLNPSLRKTRELMIQSYLLHQAVYRAFPDRTDGGSGRVLYRVDQNQRSGTVALLVQSEKEPDWHKAEYLCECLLNNIECKPVSPSVVEGQHLLFRLRANPSVKKQTEGKKNGYRLGLLREEDQLSWLNRKAGTNGFSLMTCRVVTKGIVHDDKSHANQDKASHFGVLFEGELEVSARRKASASACFP